MNTLLAMPAFLLFLAFSVLFAFGIWQESDKREDKWFTLSAMLCIAFSALTCCQLVLIVRVQ